MPFGIANDILQTVSQQNSLNNVKLSVMLIFSNLSETRI